MQKDPKTKVELARMEDLFEAHSNKLKKATTITSQPIYNNTDLQNQTHTNTIINDILLVPPIVTTSNNNQKKQTQLQLQTNNSNDITQQQQLSANSTIIIILSIGSSLLGIGFIVFIAYIIYQNKYKRKDNHSIESPRLVGASIPIARLLNIQSKIKRPHNVNVNVNNITDNQNNNDSHSQIEGQIEENVDEQIEGQNEGEIQTDTNTKDIIIQTPEIHELSFSV